MPKVEAEQMHLANKVRWVVMILLAMLAPLGFSQGMNQNCSTVHVGVVDDIRALPPNPSAGQGFLFELTGGRPISPIDIFSVSQTVSGAAITVDARMSDLSGFAVGGTYCYRLAVAGLPAGNYVVSYFVESFDGASSFLPPRLVATTTLVVAEASAASTIPTLSVRSLFLISALIALTGCFLSRRLRNNTRLSRCLVIALVATSLANAIDSATAATMPANYVQQTVAGPSVALIIVFDPRQNSPSVATILNTVNSSDGKIQNADLYARLGRPVVAQRLIARPATNLEIQAARANPVAPAALLGNYVFLGYAQVSDLETILPMLQADRQVLAVEKDFAMSFSATPTDSYFSPVNSSTPTSQFQWGMRTPATSAAGLNFPNAWDKVPGHAYVAMLDNGIQENHPDLQQSFRRQFAHNAANDLWYNEVDELVSGGTYAGHGSHTAGIVAATTNNVLPGGGPSVAGGCWYCSLIIERINPAFFLSVARAVDNAVQSGAQVINLSFGAATTNTCSSGPSDFLSECSSLTNAGYRAVTLVAASGNQASSTINFPATHPAAIAVGGIEPDGSFWTSGYNAPNDAGSNYGSQQAVVAPAKDVLSSFYQGYVWNPAVRCSDRLDSQSNTANVFATGYGDCNGTSQAAPHVSALAGLVRSANPLLSSDDTRNVITTTASRAVQGLARTDQMGYGIPDAALATQKALGASIAINRLTPLFSFYSSEGQNHFYTTVPQMALAAIGGTLQPTPDYVLSPQSQYVSCTQTTILCGGTTVPISTVTVYKPGTTTTVPGVDVVFTETSNPDLPYQNLYAVLPVPWPFPWIAETSDYSGSVTVSGLDFHPPLPTCGGVPNTTCATITARALSRYQLSYAAIGQSIPGYATFPTGCSPSPDAKAIVSIFSSSVNPGSGSALIPLYRMSYRCGDELLTVPPSSANPACSNNVLHVSHVYATSASDVQSFTGYDPQGNKVSQPGIGYAFDGIEGYVYSKSSSGPPGTVKLCRKYDGNDSDRDDWVLFPGTGTNGTDCGGTGDGYVSGTYDVPTDSTNWLGWVYPVRAAQAFCSSGIPCDLLGQIMSILSDD
jgi:Subtilase family